jgi:hypothetical protein
VEPAAAGNGTEPAELPAKPGSNVTAEEPAAKATIAPPAPAAQKSGASSVVASFATLAVAGLAVLVL